MGRGNRPSHLRILTMIKPAQAAPLGKKHRVSSDSAWPLRGVDGLTFAERKAKEQEQGK
jgi:hypothetical protein